MSIACVILTYNEEIHLERCISSIIDLVDEIIVLDSFSTDGTPRIVERYNAKFIQRKFISQADQMNWLLNNYNIKQQWIMRLDADEYIDNKLKLNIKSFLQNAKKYNGIILRRRHIFMGKWIKFGGRYPIKLLRIWRNGTAVSEQKLMDEHMVLTSGKAKTLAGGFYDHNLNDITYFINKHLSYSKREALERNRVQDKNEISHKNFKQWLKKHMYNRIPMPIGPLLYFFLRYVILLGFLDGKAGFIYHFLQGFWYRLLVELQNLENKEDNFHND